MSIKSQLKKEGIIVIRPLDTLVINSIASNIVNIIEDNFSDNNYNTNQLFANLSRLNMYVAKLPYGAQAKYFYKNNSIYFNEDTSFYEINDIILHECIHFLQEKRNSRGKLIKLGLCDFNNKNFPGLGLNEACTQLLASNCMRKKSENVTYFGLSFDTISPNYYPLECALVNQLAYLYGKNILFSSTLNATDDFKSQFISLTSKESFEKVRNNIDSLVDKENELDNLCLKVCNSKNALKIGDRINTIKLEIQSLFLDTQNLIITTYFDSTINLLYSKDAFDEYRKKLFNFRSLLASADGYTFFNRYYINKMVQLDEIKEYKFEECTSLIVKKEQFINVLLNKFKAILGLRNGEYGFLNSK